jgi:hypothetical protein
MFSVKNSDHIDLVVGAILEKFGGQVVHNATLKEYLINTLPEMFPSGRADRCIEFLASVAFRSTVRNGVVGGVAFLEGIKDGKKRYWRVPMNTDNVVAKSDVPIESLGEVIRTRKATIPFGQYVAASKKKGPKEEG